MGKVICSDDVPPYTNCIQKDTLLYDFVNTPHSSKT